MQVGPQPNTRQRPSKTPCARSSGHVGRASTLTARGPMGEGLLHRTKAPHTSWLPGLASGTSRTDCLCHPARLLCLCTDEAPGSKAGAECCRQGAGHPSPQNAGLLPPGRPCPRWYQGRQHPSDPPCAGWASDPRPRSLLSAPALEGRNKLPSTGRWCREAGSHSLGLTQSLMYAFSRACIVFTTANSSAMLSYLRGRILQMRPPRQGSQGPGA